MNSSAVIQLRDVDFAYGADTIIRGATFEVARGEFLAIIGPNGGGKTTLLKLMLGLIKPSHGQIRILGEAPPPRGARVGYVPQFVQHAADFPLTVRDAVMLGRMGLRSGRTKWNSEDLQRVNAALELVEMGHCAEQRLGELSGGQRQRVLVARALVAEPELLFLDEPSSNIDAAGQRSLFQLLNELNRRMTIVVVSHDLMALSQQVRSVACVNRTVHYHLGSQITEEMVGSMYNCPVDLVAHGLPHRVLAQHGHPHSHP